MTQRFKRLTDLFVQGKTVKLPDGTYLWVQAINAYERDECISDAQTARSRLVMALRERGDEHVKIEARMAERGRDAMVVDLATAKVEGKYADIVADIEADPDWKERVEMLRRKDDAISTPLSTEESELLQKVSDDWYAEISSRVEAEQAHLVEHYTRVDDQDLLHDYLEAWLDRRGSDVATAEYALTELWYATRYCEATVDADGTVSHARCGGHPERVFESKTEARAMPDGLRELLVQALAELTWAARDPKDSASPQSSSDSSPTPNEPAESTPSTSTETPDAPPGT